MSLQSEIKKLIKTLIKEGWTEEFGKHRKLYHPKGGFVSMSMSPSDYNAVRQIERDIKKLRKINGESV